MTSFTLLAFTHNVVIDYHYYSLCFIVEGLFLVGFEPINVQLYNSTSITIMK